MCLIRVLTQHNRILLFDEAAIQRCPKQSAYSLLCLGIIYLTDCNPFLYCSEIYLFFLKNPTQDMQLFVSSPHVNVFLSRFLHKHIHTHTCLLESKTTLILSEEVQKLKETSRFQLPWEERVSSFWTDIEQCSNPATIPACSPSKTTSLTIIPS